MNVKNNKRKKESQNKIERVFIELLQTKEVKDITVSDICKLSGLNRSTFYSNYIDIYDLVDKIKEMMIEEFFSVYKEEAEKKAHSYNFLKLFQHIKDNQIFYKTYFKLDFDLTHFYEEKFLDEEFIAHFNSVEYKNYHVAFFKAGFNAIVKTWLDGGCEESPEEIEQILIAEYKNRTTL